MATAILRKEHDLILQMLDVTEKVASLLEGKQSVSPEVLDDLLDFIRGFADRCHHAKEEDLLFPRLEAKGMPRQGGPLGVMLQEHEQGRAFVREMAGAAESYRRGEEGAAGQWAGAARGYVALLRDHIAKENNVLFVMAENLLGESELIELTAAFEKVDSETIGTDTVERLRAVAGKLSSEFLGA